MHVRLLTALFALAALVLAAVPARAQEDTPVGSIAIRGSLLTTPEEDPAAAPAADGFGSVTILTPDGRTLTLADADLHGVNYVWEDDNLGFGSYYVDTSGIIAPEGFTFLRMTGGMEDNGGYLVDLTADALARSPELDDFSGRVSDSGEGRWTVLAAVDEGVPAPVITTSLFERFQSRQLGDFTDKILSAMRSEFGGHAEKK